MMMQLTMVLPAQRNRKFVAHLAAQRARLGEFQVMRIASCSLANQARLRRNKSEMRLVSLLHRLANGLDLMIGFSRRGSDRGLIGQFDRTRVWCLKRVLGRQAPVGPERQILIALKPFDLGDQFIPQHHGCFSR